MFEIMMDIIHVRNTCLEMRNSMGSLLGFFKDVVGTYFVAPVQNILLLSKNDDNNGNRILLKLILFF